MAEGDEVARLRIARDAARLIDEPRRATNRALTSIVCSSSCQILMAMEMSFLLIEARAAQERSATPKLAGRVCCDRLERYRGA
jgi:hypothetical protein